MNPDNTLIAYRMAWAKAILMSLSGAIVSWTSQMAGVKWSDLDGTEQFGVILGCIGAMIVVIIAFLDRTISRIEAERAGIPGTKEHQIATGTGDGNKPPPSGGTN